MSRIDTSFVLKTALRDARTQWRQLLVFTGSILAGIAALVAILSFRSDVLRTVDAQSRDLLGADLTVEANEPFSEAALGWMDSLKTTFEGRTIEMVEFTSMVLYGEALTPRLSRVRAVEEAYPLYGELGSDPAGAISSFAYKRGAVVEKSYLQELGLALGDTVQVGLLRLPIVAALTSVPGESDAFALIGPRVYVPHSLISESGLLQRGSQVEYRRIFAFQQAQRDPAGFSKTLEETMRSDRDFRRSERLRTETVESRKEDFAQVIGNLSKFLGLIAFIALLLGGLGVGSSIHVYIRRRIASIATLRCLGVASRQILGIFLLQILALGVIGGLLGTLLGLSIQWALPALLSEFLPFTIVQGLSWQAVGLGLATGLLVSFSFALLPILSLTQIPPLLAIQTRDVSPLRQLPRWVVATSLGISFGLITGTLGLLLGSGLAAVIFTLSLVMSAGILTLIAYALMWSVQRIRMAGLPYVMRQSLSNLHRPNNQSVLLMTTLGMGMLILGTMILSRDMVLERINFTMADEQPNLVFYDIQSWQNEGVNELIRSNGSTPAQNVPIVTMRLAKWKGRDVADVARDSSLDISGWALRREFRVTYRDTLTPAETLKEGEWMGRFDGDPFTETIPISFSTDLADDLAIALGDTLTFDVQGIAMQTRIASLRAVEWQRPEPNFFVVFPAGVLEIAPQFFATTLRVEDEATKRALQSAVVSAYPNVSAIDISAVLTSVRSFLSKISTAVQFIAGFSILTGLFVLAGALSTSRLQRIRESVLLRTLGAIGGQIRTILLLEVGFLGILAAMTGLILAVGASWALAVFYFELPYIPDFVTLGWFSGGLVLLAIFVGWSGSRSIVGASPLQILRTEGA